MLTPDDVKQIIGLDSKTRSVVVHTPTETRVVDLWLGEGNFPFIPIHLDPFGSVIFTIAPLDAQSTSGADAETKSSESYIASLGLVDKYNALAGQISCGFASSDASSAIYSATFRATGLAGFYLLGPVASDVDGLSVLIGETQVSKEHWSTEALAWGGVLLKVNLEPYIDNGPKLEVHLRQAT